MRAISLVPLHLRLFLLIVSVFFSFQTASFANKHNVEKSKHYVKEGTSYFESKRFNEALASFQMALHYNSSPDLHFHIAQCQMELGDYESALENFSTYRNQNKKKRNANLVESRILEAKQRLGIIAPQTASISQIPQMNLRPKSQLTQISVHKNASKAKTAPKEEIPSAPTPPPLPAPEFVGATNEPGLLPLVPTNSKDSRNQNSSSATLRKTNANQPLSSLPARETQAAKSNEIPPSSHEGAPTESTTIISAPLDMDKATPRDFSTNSDEPHSLFEPTPAEKAVPPIYKKWWFWSVTGSVLAASAGALIYATTTNSEPMVMLPSGSLGRIDRR